MVCDTWQSIETAPKDGRAILLLSAYYESPGTPPLVSPPTVYIGHWDAEGTSWVDEHGRLGGDCYTLATTGFWESGGGWFQPNEVTHWMELPLPPPPEQNIRTLFITRKMLIDERLSELFAETIRRNKEGCCVYCGVRIDSLNQKETHMHTSQCRARAFEE